ncbi:hypothetical protein [Geomicrobium sediminis]|uniref:DNA-binding transcriptional regulator YafY n=1 Tax=Geomicrobium sediminis TaxID=1347788 RepID=A0ABS2PEE2_9BACL|nr:hypothetical protein [Geomicrobium sediminis]MBM7633802.1 putative DNA-binding transcriptional regulator YafY [Geomicrobium sediminis]
MNSYVLQHSLSSGEPVNIIYEAKDGSLSQRLVTVRRMDKKTALVWCHKREDIRTMQVVNILAAEKQKEYA